MASMSSTTELQEARSLAQKLFSQCRESASSYKLLAGSVRTLRNGLEEVEEIFDDSRTLGPDDLKLLDQVGRSRDLLDRLDLSLQSFRCSKHKDVNERAVADLKTDLDVTARELGVAFEAFSTGEIPLALDTRNIADIADSKSPSTNRQSASSSKDDSAQEPRSSRTSSAWSLIPQDSPSKGISFDIPHMHLDTNTQRQLSQEKEVYNPSAASKNSVVEPTVSLDWRSPFASPDPMSISIEQASSIILGGDDYLTPSLARPRSITGPPNIHTSDTALTNETETTALLGNVASEDGIAKRRHETEALDYDATRRRGYSDSRQQLGRQSAVRVLEADISHRIGTPKSQESIVSDAPRPSSDVISVANHLSPKTVTEEFGRRSRNNSATSITFSVRSAETGEPRESGKLEPEGTLAGEDQGNVAEAAESSTMISSPIARNINTPTEERGEPAKGVVSPPRGLNIIIEPTLDGADTQPGIEHSRASEPQHTSSTENQDDTVPPPLPARKPPPPPPRLSTTVKPRRSATYRVVNATSPTSPSSDEEGLYSSSRPTSPVEASNFQQAEPEKREVPTVNVDESACEDTSQVEHERRRSKGYERAKRVLERAAGTVHVEEIEETTPGLTIKSSTASLNTGKAEKEEEESQPLHKRFSTSVLPSDSSRSSFEHYKFDDRSTPTIPTRPLASRNRYRSKSHSQNQTERPAPATTRTGPPAIPKETAEASEKESISGIGLEVDNWLETKFQAPRLPDRIGIDAALSVRSPSVSTKSSGNVLGTERQLRSAPATEANGGQNSSNEYQMTGWYGPGVDDTSITDLDKERIDHIVHFWNNGLWDQAEAYLTGYLESLNEQDALGRARRVRHLLGVCASFKGQWSRAIPLFLSVLRAPIERVEDIDDGDCSAAYWLGDAYSLLNQRTEALLAYCVAECSSIFHGEDDTALSDLINAEQEAVQLGLSRADFKLRWAQEALNNNTCGKQSILDKNIISTSAAKMLLEPRRPRRSCSSFGNKSFHLDPNSTRSNSLFRLSKLVRPFGKYHRMKLTPEHLDPDTPWPMSYDPTFAMRNVQRGRLLAYECDLITVFTSTEAKIPKSGPIGKSRMDCFTCADLNWLILTIRSCLSMLEMESSEVANVEGTWFVVRYTFMKGGIATTNYFSIALFKLSVRSGYGVEICPDGISSARIIRSDYEHDKGVHQSEGKRVKKLIREYLDEAVKQRPKVKKSSIGSYQSGNAAIAAVEDVPPPMPPRPTRQ